jgi:O-antigen/teichoic acid export membrane protein
LLPDTPPVVQSVDGAEAPVFAAPVDRRRQLVAGLTWNALYQVFEVALSFAAMLLLVRIIAPNEYGRAATVIGILGLLNIFNARVFYEHALQLPEGCEPDWSLHWRTGLWLQIGLSLVCHAIAALCWLGSAYQPIAKLLHLAAFGVMFDAANQLGGIMLRRDLNFRRLKVVAAYGMAARLAVTVGFGLAGGRAYAIVLGNNVISSLPFAIDLFVVRRWRPRGAWWRPPSLRDYRDPLTFGIRRITGSLIGGVREAIEAAILPRTIGFASIGLVNRAQALYGTTVGRVGTLFADTVYPFLPRESRNPIRYASHATLYLQIMALMTIPGAVFIGYEGPALSRVLYGQKWVAMDPLIWPGALMGLAVVMFATASNILLAAGQLRACLTLDGVAAVSVTTALAVAWWTGAAVPYAWSLACAQVGAAVVAIQAAASQLEARWWQTALLPPLAVVAVGIAAVRIASPLTATWPPALSIAAAAALLAVSALVVMRAAFPNPLLALISRLPAGDHLARAIRLGGAPAIRGVTVHAIKEDLPRVAR